MDRAHQSEPESERERGAGRWMKDVRSASDSKQSLCIITVSARMSARRSDTAAMWADQFKVQHTDGRLQEENVSVPVICIQSLWRTDAGPSMDMHVSRAHFHTCRGTETEYPGNKDKIFAKFQSPPKWECVWRSKNRACLWSVSPPELPAPYPQELRSYWTIQQVYSLQLMPNVSATVSSILFVTGFKNIDKNIDEDNVGLCRETKLKRWNHMKWRCEMVFLQYLIVLYIPLI